MKFRLATLSALLTCVLFTPALLAQDEEGGNRGGPGGRQGGRQGGMGGRQGGMGMGGMGMGMRGGRTGGGAMELIGLLRMEEVRTDIKMTEEDYEILQNQQAELTNEMRGMRDLSEEERTAKMKEIGEKANSLFDEVLQTEQQKRLMGLLVQQSGHVAALNDLIAKEIGLSEEDKEKIKTKTDEAREQMMSEMQGGQPGGEGGRPDFTAMRAKMQTTMNEAVDSVLTDEQEAALEALKGETFKFPEQQFGGRGQGGRGQGGPGAGGGRGQGGPGGGRGQRGE